MPPIPALAKQFENVAYSDMSAKLGHTLIPMFAERVHRFAKDQNRMQAEKAKQDLVQEEVKTNECPAMIFLPSAFCYRFAHASTDLRLFTSARHN